MFFHADKAVDASLACQLDIVAVDSCQRARGVDISALFILKSPLLRARINLLWRIVRDNIPFV